MFRADVVAACRPLHRTPSARVVPRGGGFGWVSLIALVVVAGCAETVDDPGTAVRHQATATSHYDFENEVEAGYCAAFVPSPDPDRPPVAMRDGWGQSFDPERERPTWSRVIEGPHFDGREVTVDYSKEAEPITAASTTRAPDWDYISNNFLVLDSLALLASTLTSFSEQMSSPSPSAFARRLTASLDTCAAFDDVSGLCVCGTGPEDRRRNACLPEEASPEALLAWTQELLDDLLDTLLSELSEGVPGDVLETAQRQVQEALDGVVDGDGLREAVGLRPALAWILALLGVEVGPEMVPGPSWLNTDLRPEILGAWAAPWVEDPDAPEALEAPLALPLDILRIARGWAASVEVAAETYASALEDWLTEGAVEAVEACEGLPARVSDLQAQVDAFLELVDGVDEELVELVTEWGAFVGDLEEAAVRDLRELVSTVVSILERAWELRQFFAEVRDIESLAQVQWDALIDAVVELGADVASVIDGIETVQGIGARFASLSGRLGEGLTATRELANAFVALARDSRDAGRALFEEAEACAIAVRDSVPEGSLSMENCRIPALEDEEGEVLVDSSFLCQLLSLDVMSEVGLPGQVRARVEEQFNRATALVDAVEANLRAVFEGLPSEFENIFERMGQRFRSLFEVGLASDGRDFAALRCLSQQSRCGCNAYCEEHYDGVWFWAAVDYAERPVESGLAQGLFFLEQIGFLDQVVSFIVDEGLGSLLGDLGEEVEQLAEAIGDIADVVTAIADFFGDAFRYIDEFASGYHLGAYSELRPDLHMCIGWAGHGPMATFGGRADGEGADDERRAFAVGGRFGSHNLSRAQRLQFRSGGFAVSAGGLDLSLMPAVEINMQVDGFKPWNPLRPFGLPLGAGAGAFDDLADNVGALAYMPDGGGSALRDQVESGSLQLVRNLYPVRPADWAPGSGGAGDPDDAANTLWPRLPAGLNLGGTWREVPEWEQRSVAVASFGLNLDFEISESWELPPILLFSTGTVDVTLQPSLGFSFGVEWKHQFNAFMDAFLAAQDANLPEDFRDDGLTWPEDFARDMHAMQAPDVSADNMTAVRLGPFIKADLNLTIGARLIEVILGASMKLELTLKAGGWGGVLDANVALAELMRHTNPDGDATCEPVLSTRSSRSCSSSTWGACATNEDCPAGRYCARGGDDGGGWCMPGCDRTNPCPFGRCEEGICRPPGGYTGFEQDYACEVEEMPTGSCGITVTVLGDALSQTACVDGWTGFDRSSCEALEELLADSRFGPEAVARRLETLDVLAPVRELLLLLGPEQMQQMPPQLEARWSNESCNARDDGFGTPEADLVARGLSSLVAGAIPCSAHGYCLLADGRVHHGLTAWECQVDRFVGAAFVPYHCERDARSHDEIVLGWTGAGCHPLQGGFPSACGCAADADCAEGERCRPDEHPTTGEQMPIGHCVTGPEGTRGSTFSCSASPGPCPAGRVAVAGACLIPCGTDDDCGTDRVCTFPPAFLGAERVPVCRPRGANTVFTEEVAQFVRDADSQYPAHAITSYALASFEQLVTLGLGLTLDLKVRFLRNPLNILDLDDVIDLASNMQAWYQPGLEARYHHECHDGQTREGAAGSDAHLFDPSFSPITNYQPFGTTTGGIADAANAALGATGLRDGRLCAGESGVCRYRGDLEDDGSSPAPANVPIGNTGRSVGEFLDWCAGVMPDEREPDIRESTNEQLTGSIVDTASFTYDLVLDYWQTTELCVGDEPLEEFLGSMFVQGEGPPVLFDGTPNLVPNLDVLTCEYRGRHTDRCSGSDCLFPCGQIIEALGEIWGCMEIAPSGSEDSTMLDASIRALDRNPEHLRRLTEEGFALTLYPDLPPNRRLTTTMLTNRLLNPSVPDHRLRWQLLRPGLFDPDRRIMDIRRIYHDGRHGAEPFSFGDMGTTFAFLYYPGSTGIADPMPEQRADFSAIALLSRNIGLRWHSRFTSCMDERSSRVAEHVCSCTRNSDCTAMDPDAVCSDAYRSVVGRNICVSGSTPLQCSPVRVQLPGEVQECPDAPDRRPRPGGDDPDFGVPGGACCTSIGEVTGCMQVEHQEDCAAVGGTYTPGASCSPAICPGMVDETLGGCCRPDGFCVEAITERMCTEEHEGTFNPGLPCEQCLCAPARIDLGSGDGGCAAAGAPARPLTWMILLLGLLAVRRRRRLAVVAVLAGLAAALTGACAGEPGDVATGPAALPLCGEAVAVVLGQDATMPKDASTGACCVAAGCFPDVPEFVCDMYDGAWHEGTPCDVAASCPTIPEVGACCMEVGGCAAARTERECEALVGTWLPRGTCGACPEGRLRTSCCVGGVWGDVATGDGFACALSEGGVVACFDETGNASIRTPPGVMTAIAAAGEWACAVEARGVVTCFGPGRVPELAPPDRVTHLAMSPTRACTLDEDGSLTCWGRAGSVLTQGELDDRILTDIALDPTGNFLYGVEPDGTILPYLVRRAFSGPLPPFRPRPLTALPLEAIPGQEVFAAHGLVCAVHGETVTCVPDGDAGCEAANGILRPGSLFAPFECTVCGRTPEGALDCIGPVEQPDRLLRGMPPERADSDQGRTCGVLEGGGVTCWNLGDGTGSIIRLMQPPAAGTCVETLLDGCPGTELTDSTCQSPDDPCADLRRGACCTAFECVDGLQATECSLRGGVFNDGMRCNDRIDCPATEAGACCGELPGTCTEEGVDARRCAAAGGTWYPDRTCEDVNSCAPEAGDCCAPVGCFEDVRPSFCASLGGTFVDAGGCAAGVCQQLPERGACCDMATGECHDRLDADACAALSDAAVFTPGLRCGACDCRPVIVGGDDDIGCAASGARPGRGTLPLLLAILAGVAVLRRRSAGRPTAHGTANG
ncbi:MAG: hypothetical protein EA398_10660 [Deltaproteobacteria bacterium]|nr:MAG: hypothetical protein EA398_10660 [Deltaproteobacteria bacterium]